MSRILTFGGEAQSFVGEGFSHSANGTPTFDTTNVRVAGTAASISIAPATSVATYLIASFAGGALGRTYYLRFYFRTDTPNLAARIGNFQVAGGSTLIWRLDATGHLYLSDAGNTTIGSVDSVALSANTWYRIEVIMTVPNPATGTTVCSLLRDGTYITNAANVTALTNQTAPTAVWLGGVTAVAATRTYWIDDVALNDDQGTDQNGLPGAGTVWLLAPASDSARTGWTAGGGATTGLFTPVGTMPSVGVADASATNTSQIRDANSSATDNYDATLQTYTAAGIPTSDTITLVQAVAVVGAAQSGTLAGVLFLVSNPAEASETSFGAFRSGTTNVGTFPTGWKFVSNSVIYSPTVTIGTGPVLRVGKRTANTNVADVTMMALLVESQPSSGVSLVMEADGVGTLTNTEPLVSHSFVTESDGAGTATATLTVAHPLVVEADGASVATATLSISHPLVVSTAGVGTGTAALSISHALVAESDGTGVATVALTVSHPLVLSASGTSSLTNTEPLVSHSFVTEADGASTAVASLSISHPFVAESDGVGVATIGLTVAQAFVVEADGAGVASLALGISHPLTVSSAGVSVATAGVTTGAGYVCSTFGVGVASASLVVSHPFVAESDGVSAATSTISISHPLVAEADGVGTTNLALSVVHSLAVSSAGASTATASLTVAHPLLAESDGTSVANLTIVVTRGIVANAVGVSVASVAVVVSHPLLAESDGVSTAVVDLTIITPQVIVIMPTGATNLQSLEVQTSFSRQHGGINDLAGNPVGITGFEPL